MTRFENLISRISTPALMNKRDSLMWCVDAHAVCIIFYYVILTRQQCCSAKLILWLTDKPRLLLFCFSVLFHMYEALKQTQNKKFCFVLGLFWICFGLVLRCFVSVVRAALNAASFVYCYDFAAGRSASCYDERLCMSVSVSVRWHALTSSSAIAERPRDACSTSCCAN